MSKYFIKVDVNKSPKNKLGEAVMESVRVLNQTLWPSRDEAVEQIKKKNQEAIDGYTGRAKMDAARVYYDDSNKVSVFFGDNLDGGFMQARAYRILEDHSEQEPGSKAAVYDKIDAILKEAYPEDDEESQDENIDLCWIGERVARIFGYL